MSLSDQRMSRWHSRAEGPASIETSAAHVPPAILGLVNAGPHSEAIWDDYRRLRRQWWFALLIFPAVGAVGAVANALFRNDTIGRVIWFILGGSCLLSSSLAIIRVNQFSCARCRQIFVRRRFYGNFFTNSCLHCGLRVGESLSALERL